MLNVFKRALSQYGVSEIVGDQHNKKVLEYFKEVGHEWVKNDELAWCAAFVGWCLSKEGYDHSGKLNARSYLQIGQRTEHPKLGDIVVLWRVKEDSIYGHVGFYVNEDENYIYVLGGNQKNQVNILPYRKSRLLQYRRPTIK